jgi:hypothetical protein
MSVSEIELYFGGEDPHMTLHAVEYSCPTELMNLAHRMAQEQRAEHVSFGPPVERDADGSPKVEKRRG